MKSFTFPLFFWYIFPVILLFACDFIVNTLGLTKRFKIKMPDLAVPFLLLGIHEISRHMSSFSILPYYLLSITLLGIGIVLFQAYHFREITYGRFFKMFWRMTFLLTLLLYLIMIIISIIMQFTS